MERGANLCDIVKGNSFENWVGDEVRIMTWKQKKKKPTQTTQRPGALGVRPAVYARTGAWVPGQLAPRQGSLALTSDLHIRGEGGALRLGPKRAGGKERTIKLMGDGGMARYSGSRLCTAYLLGTRYLLVPGSCLMVEGAPFPASHLSVIRSQYGGSFL